MARDDAASAQENYARVRGDIRRARAMMRIRHQDGAPNEMHCVLRDLFCAKRRVTMESA